MSAYNVFRVGAVQLDEAHMELTVDSQRRPIEAKPLALLAALLKRAGTLATKRELIEAVWGNADHISEASLTTAMSKLRAALGEHGREIIEVVHGSGYRISAPVEVSAARRAAHLALALAEGDTVPGRPQWRLEKLLGEKSLADVWLARHSKTGELRVFKFADSERRLETLRRETSLSRVLHATLGDRDDLVRIVEWNFEARPWFIESAYGGVDLLRWAEEGGRLAAMSLDARVSLVARVARTIAAAHAAGVLHSDIKPANILVQETLSQEGGDGPRLRLVDFGAGGLSDTVREALAISLHGLTGAEGARGTGTLRYMAPEVLAGGVPTTAADVYALGILLYQVAVGDLKKTLTVGWEADIADPLLRQDIADAAAGDPLRRLASAASLAERLETLDERRAEKIFAEQAAERAEKLARQVERERLRRPWMMAAAFSLVAGLALSTYFGLRAVHDRDEARRRAGLAQAVNDFLTEDLLGRGNPAKSGKAEETLMEAAEAAEAGIGRRLSGEPLVAGSIYLSLARAFESRGAFDASRTAYGNAIEAFGRAGKAGEADGLIAILHQASMEVISGQPGSLARARAMIAEAAPRVAAAGSRQAEAKVWLLAGRGTLEMLGGDVRKAQAAFRSAADLADAIPDVFDEASRLSLRQQEAFTYLRLGEWDRASSMMKALLARRLLLNGPRHTATLQLELNLAQVSIAKGQAAYVLPDLNRLLPDFTAVFGPDHQRTMTLLATRATALAQLERYDEAAADDQTLYRDAVTLQGPDSYFAIGALSDAADAQCRAGHTEAGLQTARASHARALQKFGAAHVLTQMSSGNLALCLILAGDAAQAAPLLDRIDAKAVAEMAVDPLYGAEIDVMRAAIAQAQGDEMGAKSLLKKAAPAFERADADKYFGRWVRRLLDDTRK